MSDKKSIPKILKKLNSVNYKKTIKIRYKKLKNSYSLYLDTYKNNEREYEFLKMYIHGKAEKREEDDKTLRLSIALRDKKELELMQERTGIKNHSWKDKANFVEYFKSIADKKTDVGKTWQSAYNYLKKFTNGKIQIRHIDENYCESFLEYLYNHVSESSANLYFSKFKIALNKTVKDKILLQSPTKNIRLKHIETEREFLTFEELQKLALTPCKDQQLKNAFLFSCYTGLRISDILKLTFDNISDGVLRFKQKKTNGVERMKLSDNVVTIIEQQKSIMNNDSENLIFNLKSMGSNSRYLKEWTQVAGIKKHITFHCARHTFATMCLTYDVDLYTVSKLLGHKDIQSTQIYAKLIDKKKDEAIDKLPNLKLAPDQD